MVKKIAAVVLILLAGGGWFYLDYLNKQELLAAEQSRKVFEQARAQAKARADAAAKFETQIAADLTACQATAEKEKEDFLIQHQQPVKRKPGQFTIPQEASDEAMKTLQAATAACQATRDSRLKSGS